MTSSADEETREVASVVREDTTEYLRVTVEDAPDEETTEKAAGWSRRDCAKSLSAATEETSAQRRQSGSGGVALCCVPRLPRKKPPPPPPRVARGRMSLAEQKEHVRGKMQQRRRESVQRASVLSYVPYDWTKSTRDNHQAKETDPDYGQFSLPFKEVRESLDHSYHGMYKMTRQHDQDRLIEHVLEHGEAQDRPWIVFTAGAMGAGKSRTMTWLSDSGYFPLSQVSSSQPDMACALSAATIARRPLCVLTRRRAASSGRNNRR